MQTGTDAQVLVDRHLSIVFFMGFNLLSWSSKRQQAVSRSSAESEYRGVANAVAETSWLRNLLLELHNPLSSATVFFWDNVSAVYMSSNPVQHQRTKHIEIHIHFAGQVRVLHVLSRYQYANIFTKGLPFPLFSDFRNSLSVRCLIPAQRAGAYYSPLYCNPCICLIGLGPCIAYLYLVCYANEINQFTQLFCTIIVFGYYF